MQLVDLSISKHITALLRYANDRYVRVIAAHEVQHVRYSFAFTTPVFSVLGKQRILIHGVSNMLHQPISDCRDVPFVIVNTWLSCVQHDDRMWHGRLIYGRFKRCRSPIEQQGKRSGFKGPTSSVKSGAM